MGQVLFLKTGGGSGGGAQSLQAAYSGGRDLELAYGSIRINAEGEGLLSGESALVVGISSAEKDVSLLTLAKVFPGDYGGATNPPLVVGNLGSDGPAVQVFGIPNTSAPPDLTQDYVDTVGLDVVYGGPEQGHHTQYSLHGIRWLKWRPSDGGFHAGQVGQLRLNYVPEQAFDYALLQQQERTQLELRVAQNETRTVARFYRTTIPIESDEGPLTFDINHGLSCLPVVVQVYRHFTAETDPIMVEVRDFELRILDQSSVQLRFNGSPQGGSIYHVAVVGY